jgi:hypothetical protein
MEKLQSHCRTFRLGAPGMLIKGGFLSNIKALIWLVVKCFLRMVLRPPMRLFDSDMWRWKTAQNMLCQSSETAEKIHVVIGNEGAVSNG